MRNLIYLMNLSLDGFVEGPDGRFDWTRPDEEVHRFHNGLADGLGAFLYGRRMYETMRVWQTIDEDAPSPDFPDYAREFARIWKSKPKIVFSTTLESVGQDCRLVRRDFGAEVARLKEQPGADLGVGGPGLARTLARLDLVDEYHLVLFPITVGSGKPYFPALDHPVRLRLIESRTFKCGAVYLRYQRT
jgi:dihydrofolate reductase